MNFMRGHSRVESNSLIGNGADGIRSTIITARIHQERDELQTAVVELTIWDDFLSGRACSITSHVANANGGYRSHCERFGISW